MVVLVSGHCLHAVICFGVLADVLWICAIDWDVLLSSLHVSSSHVLVGTAISSLPRGKTVSLCSVVHPRSGTYSYRLTVLTIVRWRLEKVLCCVILSWLERRVIKVVEHKIHIFAFLNLEIVSNFDVAVDLNLNMSVCLPRQRPRLRKSTLVNLLILSIGPSRTVPNNALHLPRSCIPIRPSKIVVASNCLPASTQLLPTDGPLLRRSQWIEILEQIGLVPVVVTHVERVPCRIHTVVPQHLSAAPMVRQRIVIRIALLVLLLLLLHARSKMALGGMSTGLTSFIDGIGVGLHNFLARARLSWKC